MDNTDRYFVDSSEREPFWALFGRLLWFVIGPIVLVLLTVMIVITGSGWLTGYDLAFYITVGRDGHRAAGSRSAPVTGALPSLQAPRRSISADMSANSSPGPC